MEWKHALSNQCVIRTPWSCWRCSWQSCRRSLRRWATHLIGFVYRSVRVCYSDLLRNRNKYYKVPHIGGVGGGGNALHLPCTRFKHLSISSCSRWLYSRSGKICCGSLTGVCGDCGMTMCTGEVAARAARLHTSFSVLVVGLGLVSMPRRSRSSSKWRIRPTSSRRVNFSSSHWWSKIRESPRGRQPWRFSSPRT